jgi:hypothetical protein
VKFAEVINENAHTDTSTTVERQINILIFSEIPTYNEMVVMYFEVITVTRG